MHNDIAKRYIQHSIKLSLIIKFEKYSFNKPDSKLIVNIGNYKYEWY